MKKFALLLSVLCSVLCLASCRSVPESGQYIEVRVSTSTPIEFKFYPATSEIRAVKTEDEAPDKRR